jgi:outer membrane protein assembly factor BamB
MMGVMGNSLSALRGLGLVGVLALGLTGCWPAPGAGPNRQAFNPFESTISPANVGQLQPAWTAPVDGGGSVQAPIVDGGTVHVTSGDSVYGFRADNGGRLWRRQVDTPVPPFELMGQSFVDGDALMVGQGHGNLGGSYHTDRVDSKTGAVVGSLPAPGGMVDAIRGSAYLLDRIGFGSNGPVTQGVTITDRSDPSKGWSGIVDLWTIAENGGRPFTLGTTRAYQAGPGVLRGTSFTRGNGVRAWPVASSPGGCAPPPFDGVMCPTWSTALDGTTASTPVLNDDETTLYTGTDAGTVYAIDTATGAVRWSTQVGSAVTDTPAARFQGSLEGELYVPTASGKLVDLDGAFGSVLWTADTSARIGTQPADAGGVIFTASTDGSLHGFDAHGCGAPTCSPLWTASTGGAAVVGAPAVSAGQVYVGTADGRLLAYRLPPPAS